MEDDVLLPNGKPYDDMDSAVVTFVLTMAPGLCQVPNSTVKNRLGQTIVHESSLGGSSGGRIYGDSNGLDVHWSVAGGASYSVHRPDPTIKALPVLYMTGPLGSNNGGYPDMDKARRVASAISSAAMKTSRYFPLKDKIRVKSSKSRDGATINEIRTIPGKEIGLITGAFERMNQDWLGSLVLEPEFSVGMDNMFTVDMHGAGAVPSQVSVSPTVVKLPRSTVLAVTPSDWFILDDDIRREARATAIDLMTKLANKTNTYIEDRLAGLESEANITASDISFLDDPLLERGLRRQAKENVSKATKVFGADLKSLRERALEDAAIELKKSGYDEGSVEDWLATEEGKKWLDENPILSDGISKTSEEIRELIKDPEYAKEVKKTGVIDGILDVVKEWGPIETIGFIAGTSAVTGVGPIGKLIKDYPLVILGGGILLAYAILK